LVHGVEDWQISLAPYQDESSEGYCDTVENGRDDEIELCIPGLWPKDDYSKDGYDEEHYRKYGRDFQADKFSVEYFQLRKHCRKCRRECDRLLASQSLKQKGNVSKSLKSRDKQLRTASSNRLGGSKVLDFAEPKHMGAKGEGWRHPKGLKFCFFGPRYYLDCLRSAMHLVYPHEFSPEIHNRQ
jgi:hypothetical protein